jgi:PAS domain S-box-containing protein
MQGTETSIAETIALTFVLALIAIALLARQITHPLRSLVVGTAAVRRGDLSPQVQVTTRDELGLLGAAFNTMVTALRDERDRSQRYLNTAESILLALDIKGRITLVNRYTCSLLGWTADELLGRSWVETCLPPRIQRNLAGLFDNLLDGDMREVDNVVVTRSGQERLIEWHNTLLRDDDGVVIGTFSSGTDITERTKAVDALRVTEERMRFALEAAGVGIWDMNFATGRVKWSQILEAQCGLRPGTFDGSFRSMLRCIHRDDRKALFTTIRDAMRSGSDFTARLRSQWADGTVRCLSAVGRIHLDAKGKPVRAVGVSMDVSDAQELEQQFRQAQKMEAIGQLAGGVAHDFNNLLTAILGYCELLLEDVTPVDPRRTDIIEIQKAGVSAASLTRQLLAFSRKQLVAPTVLDVGQVAMDMQAIVRRLIREDVKIVLDHQPALGLVLADRAQIEQVVMNLVVNARDAMPNGGTLTIRTASVELDELYTKMHVGVSAGSFVSLTVSDTGIGMTPLVRSRLFEPFFTTKGAGSGTGLGLSTVHGIVMASGGHIDVVSEVGKGTSFTVYLPRTCIAATIAVGPEVTPVAERMATHTVLVVDDAEGLAELAKRLLERQGYTVLVATNTVEAMRLFEEHPSIDVVLTDVVMPDVSGPQLTSWLLARRPSLKVIYMSGYAEEALVHDAMSSPGVMFLNKPFTADILGRTIRDLFERPKPRPSRRPPKPLARIA